MTQRTQRRLTKGERVLLCWLTLFVSAVIGYLWWWTEINTNPVVAVTPPVMPSPNAFDMLQDAWGKRIPGGIFNDYVQMGAQPEFRRLPPLSTMRAHLKAEMVVFTQIRSSFQCKYQEPPIYSLENHIGQYYGNLRQLERMLYAASAIQRLSGKTGDALDMFLDSMELKTLTQQNAGLLGVLVSASIAGEPRQAGWELIDQLPAADATRGAQRYLLLVQRTPTYADVLTIEKTYGQMQRINMFQQPGWRTEDLRWYEMPDKLAILCCSKRDVMQKYNTYLDAWISAAKHPYSASVSYPKARRIIDLFPLARLLPNKQSFFKITYSRTQDHLLLAALALRAYYKTHGRYPATLSALSPAIVKTLPGDPFNSGKPLGYRLSGKRYVLYSVGPDGKDDKGVAAEQFVRENSTGDVVAGVNKW